MLLPASGSPSGVIDTLIAVSVQGTATGLINPLTRRANTPLKIENLPRLEDDSCRRRPSGRSPCWSGKLHFDKTPGQTFASAMLPRASEQIANESRALFDFEQRGASMRVSAATRLNGIGQSDSKRNAQQLTNFVDYVF